MKVWDCISLPVSMPVRKATALSKLLVKSVRGIRCLRTGVEGWQKTVHREGQQKGLNALHLGYRALTSLQLDTWDCLVINKLKEVTFILTSVFWTVNSISVEHSSGIQSKDLNLALPLLEAHLTVVYRVFWGGLILFFPFEIVGLRT